MCPTRMRASNEVEEAKGIIQFEIHDEHRVNSATLAYTAGKDID